MRILLLNQFFYPDSAATSQMLTDLAWSLSAGGHAVRAICGHSSYAASEAGEPPAIEIVRTPGTPFNHGFMARMCSYISFLLGALWHSLRGPHSDLVVTLTTPPGLGILGSLIKATTGARHFIWEMDVYPDIAIDLEVLSPGSWLTGAAGAAFDYSRRKADGIIALGECMRARLIRRGVPGDRIHVADNWADGRRIQPIPFADTGPLRILYSGNLGLAHDVDTIYTAILHFRGDRRFHFAFAGGGAQRSALEASCRKYRATNVSFEGYQALDDLGRSLGTCHIGLVTQKAATLGSVVPSKTYGLMAAGRPILYIGPRSATPARIIDRFRCGWQVDPGDTAALFALLELLAANPGLIREAGALGRQAFLRNYDLPIGVARICAILGVMPSKLLTT